LRKIAESRTLKLNSVSSDVVRSPIPIDLKQYFEINSFEYLVLCFYTIPVSFYLQNFTYTKTLDCMAIKPPTQAQAERDLSHRIQALYRDRLGHRPSQVECTLLEEKLIIVIHDSITKPEQILTQEGRTELAEQVRSQLDEVLHVQLKTIIEEVLAVSVLDLLSDATLKTGRTGIIAVLSTSPDIRVSTSSAPKHNPVTTNQQTD